MWREPYQQSHSCSPRLSPSPPPRIRHDQRRRQSSRSASPAAPRPTRSCTNATAPDYRIRIDARSRAPRSADAAGRSRRASPISCWSTTSAATSRAPANPRRRSAPSRSTRRAGKPDVTVKLSADAKRADYKLYVHSARFSQQDAAALLAAMWKADQRAQPSPGPPLTVQPARRALTSPSTMPANRRPAAVKENRKVPRPKIPASDIRMKSGRRAQICRAAEPAGARGRRSMQVRPITGTPRPRYRVGPPGCCCALLRWTFIAIGAADRRLGAVRASLSRQRRRSTIRRCSRSASAACSR